MAPKSNRKQWQREKLQRMQMDFASANIIGISYKRDPDTGEVIRTEIPRKVFDRAGF